jgi:hypothetical protein
MIALCHSNGLTREAGRDFRGFDSPETLSFPDAGRLPFAEKICPSAGRAWIETGKNKHEA